MDDKRKFLRFECSIPVEEIQSEGLNGTVHDVALDNISREGARLIMDVDTAFSPGVDVKLRISVAAEKPPIFVRGRVMWSRPKGDRYEIGLKIPRWKGPRPSSWNSASSAGSRTDSGSPGVTILARGESSPVSMDPLQSPSSARGNIG
jgi:hypothetical protein